MKKIKNKKIELTRAQICPDSKQISNTVNKSELIKSFSKSSSFINNFQMNCNISK